MKHTSKFSFLDAMEFIHGSQKLGSKLGLNNIRELTKRLGNPQNSLRFIHVAGTNGKGTVTMVVASILKEAGYHVGAYTSPFVYQFGERIMVDGVPASEEEITKHTKRVKEVCEEMVADGLPHPTEFEIVTAIGFLVFASAACDFVVLEVGLGGRLDATNVIENPLCTVITTIGYDHMQYLGNTLSEIAAEKCGIIKENVPVVTAFAQPEAAYTTIWEQCINKHASLTVAEDVRILAHTTKGIRFSTDTVSDIFIPLAGTHMAKNASCGLSAVRILKTKGINIPDEAIRAGIEAVVHRGRFETVAENPLFILDGAHNIDGIRAFRETVDQTLFGKRIVLIAGMLQDKEYEKAMEMLSGLGEALITVSVPSPRTTSAEVLAETARQFYKGPVMAAPSIPAAVDMAYQKKPDAILAFGSLYMLGDIYQAVQTREERKCV